MAIGPGTILQYKHFQKFRGQDVLNIGYYAIDSMEVLSDDLSDYAQPMFELWAENLRLQQSTGLTHVRGELYEVNGLDFGIYAPATPLAGAIGGDSMPSFVAVKVQQVRASRATRHGWKRFGGLPEASASNGQLLPAVLTEWQTIAEQFLQGEVELLSAEFPETRSINVVPIIWGGNDPAFPAGRFSFVEDVIVTNETTSQVTRKINRGS